MSTQILVLIDICETENSSKIDILNSHGEKKNWTRILNYFFYPNIVCENVVCDEDLNLTKNVYIFFRITRCGQLITICTKTCKSRIFELKKISGGSIV